MKKDLISLGLLVRRGVKVFLKDKMNVFFSLLAPLIIFLLYVLFLGDLQIDSLKQAFQGMEVDEKALNAFVDGWMLAGVMAVSTITVSFSANSLMVQDRERGLVDDFVASPVKGGAVNAFYFVYNFLVTTAICFVLLAISLVYLALSGWYLTAADVLGIIGATLFSAAASTLLSVLICGFIRSEAALGGLVGIMSAAIGFLCGAYMPLTIFPKAVQYFALILPGTYSAGIFRNLFMNGALEKLAENAPVISQTLKDTYSLNIDFFGLSLGTAEMAIVLAAFVIVLLIVNILVKKFKKGR